MAEIELSDYDPNWIQEYEQARSMVLDATRGRVRELEHIGATSVPGVAARPIIDVAVMVDEPARTEVELRLLGLNYGAAGFRVDAALPGVKLFQRPRRGFGRVTHLCYLATDSGGWASLLAVRDVLRASAAERLRFSRDKAVAAARAGEDEALYRSLKDELFAALLMRAVS